MKSHFVSLPELPAEEQERLSELKSRLKYKILDVNVKTGDNVSYNQVLATYGVYFIRTAKEVRVWGAKIKSAKNGKIKRISITKSSKVRPGQSLMVIEYCPHEMEYDGLCAFCGADISLKAGKYDSERSSTKQPTIIHGHEIGGKRKIINLTSSALLKIRRENTSSLLSSKKLALVLDIDHTFLHATRDPQAKLVYKHHAFKESTHSFMLPGHRSPYYIKIRPGFRDFLLDVAGAYDIHLYTMSMRKYAEEIVRWIEFDPKYRNLIQNLVTRDDVPSNKKLLHRLFPCDERMVIIIDDRIDVWPNAHNNVIQIHKYLFWPNTEEEQLEPDGDQRQLGSTQIILERKIKSKNKAFIEKSLRRFISLFFKELGCYNITISADRDIIYISTHKSPDDNKLKRFSLAIKEALDLEIYHNAKNDRQNNNAYLYVLRNCKIKYKINSNELKRREGDRVLSCLSSVLLKIHKNYYQQQRDLAEQKKQEPEGKKKKIDARNILKFVKADVFGGYVFVFSGVFPMDVNRMHTLEWKLAHQFGAKCVATLSADNREGVTHCITPRMGTNKTSIALKLGLEIVHPNWLHNSTTHYMESNPDIYRPQGWDKSHKKSGDGDQLTSILIGNKRKRADVLLGDDGKDNGPKCKKAKTVKFKGIDDVGGDEEDVNPREKLMEGLSELVTDFNKNKKLLCSSSSEKDIVIIADGDGDEEEDEDVNLMNNGDDNGQVGEEKEDMDLDGQNDDNFDFEDIHNDIDKAIKHIENGKSDDFVFQSNAQEIDNDTVIKEKKDNQNNLALREQHDEELNVYEEEQDEDEDNDLEDMLNEELESLSS